MSFKTIASFTGILFTSTGVFAQQNYRRSIAINGGLTFGVANRIMQRPSSFATKGEMMGSVSVSYLFKTIGRFRFGVASDLFDINYQIYPKLKAEDRPGQIRMSYHALAASNFVLSAGIIGTYNLSSSKWYNLNLYVSPGIGYLIYNSFYDHPENLNGGRTQYHPEFWEWNTVKQSKFIFPLLKAGIENEFKITRRVSVLLSFNYQQGFFNFFKVDQTNISNYNTPKETRETVTIKTNGSNYSFYLGYRRNF